MRPAVGVGALIKEDLDAAVEAGILIGQRYDQIREPVAVEVANGLTVGGAGGREHGGLEVDPPVEAEL